MTVEEEKELLRGISTLSDQDILEILQGVGGSSSTQAERDAKAAAAAKAEADKAKKSTMGSQGFSDAADLYRRVLGREPGPGEAEAWAEKFAAQNKGANPYADIKTVSDLYKVLLNREADSGGLEYFTKAFGDTIEPNEIKNFIDVARKNPDEKLSIPSMSVDEAFKPNPNAGQITASQINEFRQAAKPELQAMSQTPGFRPNQMMDQFYQPVYQAQYKNYQEAPAQPVNFENKAVADLYRNILGREPDVEGYNYFNKVFGSTVGPEQAQEFLRAATPETRLSPRAAVMTQNPAGNMFQQFSPFQQQQFSPFQQQFSPFQQQFSPFQQQFSPFQQQQQFSPFQQQRQFNPFQQQQFSPFQQQFSPFQQQQFSPFQQQQQASPFQQLQQRQSSPLQQGSNFGTMSNFSNTRTPFSSGSRGAFGGGFGGTSLYGRR